jgi:hypothetical protein
MTTRMHLILRFALATSALPGEVSAQTNGTFLLTSSNIVSPATPSTTIEIWATWDDPAMGFLFGGADYDLTAGDGLFSNPVNVLMGPGSTTGVIAGNVISGGINGQILICSIQGCLGSTDNPILIATYDWTATDFTPRAVNLVTSNTRNFVVGDRQTRANVQLAPGQFIPGAGVIAVVPAPAVWLVLGLSLAGTTRRRSRPGPVGPVQGRKRGATT